MTPEQQKLIDQARLYAEHDDYTVTRTYIRGLLEIIEQQPASVPDMLIVGETAHHPSYAMGWNDCRATMLAVAPEYKPICGASGDSSATLCQQCGWRRHSGACVGSPSIDLGRYAGTYGGYRKEGER